MFARSSGPNVRAAMMIAWGRTAAEREGLLPASRASQKGEGARQGGETSEAHEEGVPVWEDSHQPVQTG